MTIRITDSTRTIKIGVGDLVRLISDSSGLRKSGSRYSARWGQEAHKRLLSGESQDERLIETHIAHTIAVEDYSAEISGRIDLLLRGPDKTLVQEIKTVPIFAQHIENTSENDFPTFRDQLRIYLYLLDCASDYKNLTGQLLVVSLLDGSVTEIQVTYEREQVFLLVRSALLGILREHEQGRQRKEYRRSFAGKIAFPHDEPRRYQEDASAAVLRALESKNNLLLSAPTGVGKTAAVLTSLLRFALKRDLRIFWASGKSAHQRIVADTLRLVLPPDAPFCVLFLMAKEKLCPNEVFACEEELCPYSREFSAKLRQTGAVEALLRQQFILPDDVARVARENVMCPFELSLQAAAHADFIVGDYNYIFDPRASLRSLLPPNKRKEWILALDEAHNLYQRARGYFSPSLSMRGLEEAESLARADNICSPEIAELIKEVKKHLAGVGRKQSASGEKKTVVEPDRVFFSRVGSRLKEVLSDYFLSRLRAGARKTNDPLAQGLMNISAFCDTLALGVELACVYDAFSATLKLVCLDPSPQLAEKIKPFYSVIAISATLEPHRFFQDVLGFPPDETIAEGFPSPFHHENRKVLIAPSISTTYRDRVRTGPEVARLIGEVAALKAGNYAAFFPSYAYLQVVRPYLRDFSGRLIVQKAGMTEADLEGILTVLKGRRETNLILAVQGGSLAEGVDYAGSSLDGAFIVGIGLPELSLENELLKAYFDEKYSAGFQYAYLYPGMIRVIQSAGRIIRSDEDAGFIILIGRRYATPAYSSLLPRDWYNYSIEDLLTTDPVADIRAFWET
jgi:DNA excision repair protein ERCC-2